MKKYIFLIILAAMSFSALGAPFYRTSEGRVDLQLLANKLAHELQTSVTNVSLRNSWNVVRSWAQAIDQRDSQWAEGQIFYVIRFRIDGEKHSCDFEMLPYRHQVRLSNCSINLDDEILFNYRDIGIRVYGKQ